jgi:hypothetical protein
MVHDDILVSILSRLLSRELQPFGKARINQEKMMEKREQETWGR